MENWTDDAVNEMIGKVRAQRNTERALADELADVLSRMVVGWEVHGLPNLAEHPDVVAVMTRYREARGRSGEQVEVGADEDVAARHHDEVEHGSDDEHLGAPLA